MKKKVALDPQETVDGRSAETYAAQAPPVQMRQSSDYPADGLAEAIVRRSKFPAAPLLAHPAAPSQSSACFEEVVAAFAGNPRVQPPELVRGSFGSNGLKVDGRIFAMLVKGALVVKLPQERVEELVQSGEGQPFTAGQGRVMREWLVSTDSVAWLELSREAYGFVAK